MCVCVCVFNFCRVGGGGGGNYDYHGDHQVQVICTGMEKISHDKPGSLAINTH